MLNCVLTFVLFILATSAFF